MWLDGPRDGTRWIPAWQFVILIAQYPEPTASANDHFDTTKVTRKLALGAEKVCLREARSSLVDLRPWLLCSVDHDQRGAFIGGV